MDAAVELVAGGVRGRGVGQVEGEAPHAGHAARELLGRVDDGDKVGMPRVQGSDEGADRRTAHNVDGDAGLSKHHNVNR